MIDELIEKCNKSIIIDKERGYVIFTLIMKYLENNIPKEKRTEVKNLLDKKLPDGKIL